MCHWPQGKRFEQDGQIGKVFNGGSGKGSWRPYCKRCDTLHERGCLIQEFSKTNGNAIVQIKGVKGAVKGIYHIQHLNAYHSKLKQFLASFNGMSSKYLNNYLTWNNMVKHRRGSLTEKTRRLLENVVAVLFWGDLPSATGKAFAAIISE